MTIEHRNYVEAALPILRQLELRSRASGSKDYRAIAAVIHLTERLERQWSSHSTEPDAAA